MALSNQRVYSDGMVLSGDMLNDDFSSVSNWMFGFNRHFNGDGSPLTSSCWTWQVGQGLGSIIESGTYLVLMGSQNKTTNGVMNSNLSPWYWSGLQPDKCPSGCIFESRFYITPSGNPAFKFGMSDTYLGGTQYSTLVSHEGVAAGSFKFQTSDSGGTTTTGISNATIGNMGQPHTMRIHISGTTAKFYWDNILRATHTTNVPTNQTMRPFVSLAGASTTYGGSVLVDWWSFRPVM